MSNLVQPQLVPHDIRQFAEENVKKALAIGASKLNINIPFEGVRFFNKSRTAGYVIPMRENVVYLNLELLKQNPRHFEKDTIPHEVAHIFASRISKREGHHGKTWKMVMSKVFGLEPKRCHNLDTRGIGRNIKRFKYICACQKFTIGKTRHNKIQKGSIYSCKKCKKHLVFLCESD